MASPLIPILAVVAVGAAIFLGKKRGEDRGGGLEATPAAPRPKPGITPMQGLSRGPLPPPVPSPDKWGQRLAAEYPAAVDACVAEMGLVEVDRLKTCALARIFPEAFWPPPPNAGQWQRNCWFNQDLNDYIISKWPPIS